MAAFSAMAASPAIPLHGSLVGKLQGQTSNSSGLARSHLLTTPFSSGNFASTLSQQLVLSSIAAAQSERRASGSRASRASVRAAAAATAAAGGPAEAKSEAEADLSVKSPSDTTVLVVGATGYIGKFVTKELLARGYKVIAVTREKAGIGGQLSAEAIKRDFEGADVRFGDVTSLESLSAAVEGAKIDAVVSCLASRTGGKKDSWLIDYSATKNSMEAGRAAGAQHFVLLSAICVQKPLLEFQRAKLKFEAELQSDPGMSYSIVRPTAFFKSLGGQVESVKGGGPYVMFGDGQLCACKPISEADLASFIADCISDPAKKNQVLPIGGPGEALTPLQQGELLFKIVGKEPKFIKVPIEIMDAVIGFLDFLARFFPSLEDAAEFGKIGRYYAAESMLVYDPVTQKYDGDATPSYGNDTLEGFFKRVVEEGMAGQELGDQAVFK